MKPEEYSDESSEIGTTAKFNMAVATLQRLSTLLTKIEDSTADLTLPLELAQKRKILLTQQFYIQASPLLSEDFKKKHGQKILNIVPTEVKVVQRRRMNDSLDVGKTIVYSPELEILLNDLLILIQEDLQIKGHFMPPRDEEGLF